jgi:serine/threonine-protein kinase HipA
MNRCLYCYGILDKSDVGEFHGYCSEEFFGTRKVPELGYSITQMAELAKQVIERSVAVPGVQPKLSLSVVKEAIGSDQLGRLTVVGALGGNFILKPPSEKHQEMPQNEHVTMRIAEVFGIKTVKSSLIRLQSGELAYITRRIDRTVTGEKTHMVDMFQILEVADKYKSTMERVGKAIAAYSDNLLLDTLSFFELSIFCFLTGNNDMHLKNFSMIHNGETAWSLSPAYDLLNVALINLRDKEDIALMLDGKRKELRYENFRRLGEGLKLNEKQIEGVLTRAIRHKEEAIAWLDKSFLTPAFKKKYKEIIEERYTRLSK